jgi:hypothetical protein
VHFGLGDHAGVSRLEVRWAGADTVGYKIDRVDTLATIDQRTGNVTYGF